MTTVNEPLPAFGQLAVTAVALIAIFIISFFFSRRVTRSVERVGEAYTSLYQQQHREVMEALRGETKKALEDTKALVLEHTELERILRVLAERTEGNEETRILNDEARWVQDDIRKRRDSARVDADDVRMHSDLARGENDDTRASHDVTRGENDVVRGEHDETRASNDEERVALDEARAALDEARARVNGSG